MSPQLVMKRIPFHSFLGLALLALSEVGVSLYYTIFLFLYVEDKINCAKPEGAGLVAVYCN